MQPAFPLGAEAYAAPDGYDSVHATMGLSEEELGWMADAMGPGNEELQWMQEAMEEHAAMVAGGGEGMMSAEEAAWLEAQLGQMKVSGSPAKEAGAPQRPAAAKVQLCITALTASSVRLGIKRR